MLTDALAASNLAPWLLHFRRHLIRGPLFLRPSSPLEPCVSCTTPWQVTPAPFPLAYDKRLWSSAFARNTDAQ